MTSPKPEPTPPSPTIHDSLSAIREQRDRS